MSDPLALARSEIRTLEAYEHAAWQPGLVRLHANEVPWRGSADRSIAGLNRYPEPHPDALAAGLASLYGVPPACALACRGSDEAIDLLLRAFCAAGRDAVLVSSPTFGMYAVAARIQGAAVIDVPLARDHGYALDAPAIEARLAGSGIKLVFVCSPNNPTGNLIAGDDVRRVIAAARDRALVVIDEAYLEFANAASWARIIPDEPHVVVLRTLSKAHGLAGARIGTLLADGRIVAVLRRVIPPYAIAQPCIEAAQAALAPDAQHITRERVAAILVERERLRAALAPLPCVRHIWPSATNFLLVEFDDAALATARAQRAGVLVRGFGNRSGLGQALRITVGSPEQNDQLIGSLPC